MVTRRLTTGPYYRYHHLMPTPDWYDPKLYRRKKTPPQPMGFASRVKPNRLRVVRSYKARFKLNPLWVFALFATLLVVVLAILKRL